MQINNKSIIILLATYNGEKYVQEQLDSIISNKYPNMRIIISDDGSKDKTLDILEKFAKQYPFISVINHSTALHGAFHNFANLIQYVSEQNLQADYYMFSDQDDVWKSDKIEKSLLEIQKYDSGIPALVYTSKQYVDENLNPIDFTIKAEAEFDINILHQNKTYGCTFIFNNLLMEKLDSKAPVFFVNYDHYTAMQAYLFGKVIYLTEKTIMYRQHGNNVSGCVNKSFLDRVSVRKKYRNNIMLYKALISYTFQYKDLLPEKDRRIIETLQKGIASRLYLFFASLNCRIHKNSVLGTVQFYLAILFC